MSSLLSRSYTQRGWWIGKGEWKRKKEKGKSSRPTVGGKIEYESLMWAISAALPWPTTTHSQTSLLSEYPSFCLYVGSIASILISLTQLAKQGMSLERRRPDSEMAGGMGYSPMPAFFERGLHLPSRLKSFYGFLKRYTLGFYYAIQSGNIDLGPRNLWNKFIFKWSTHV